MQAWAPQPMGVLMGRRAVVTAMAACAALTACTSLPGTSAPRPTAVVSTSAVDPYGFASVPWPADEDAATAWLDRLPTEVDGMTKVPGERVGSGFDFVVYRSGSEGDDRSVSWSVDDLGVVNSLVATLDFDDGTVPCEQWASSPSLASLGGKAGDSLRTARLALPETLPDTVPWWTCTFTHDDLGEPLDPADWEWYATWVSGARTFAVSTGDEAERDALVRAAVQSAAG